MLEVNISSFILSNEQIQSLKKEVEARRLNFPEALPNIFYKIDNLNRQAQSVRANMQENYLYKLMKKVAKYLKTKGFSRLVDFVRHNIVSAKEFEYVYDMENLMQEDNDKFIQNLYLALFKRNATIVEVKRWHDILHNNSISKENIILKLYFTRERYLLKTKVSGIYKLYFSSFFSWIK